MKISTWKTSNGNVISVITSAGIYYPVGPLGSYRLSASMASAGQTAALEVITLTGESKGVLGISVNGTTSISAISTPGNQAILNSDIGIKVSAISGTLNLLMDDGRGVVIKNGYAEASLVEILSATKIPTGIRARPFDVAGCTLEMGADGLWTGASVGTLTKEQGDALVASGVMGNVKVGTPGTVEGSLMRWDGLAWVAVGGSGPVVKALSNPSYPYAMLSGAVASISAGYTVSNVIALPADTVAIKFIPHNALATDAIVDASSIVPVGSVSNANTKTTGTPITFDGGSGYTVKKTTYNGQVPRTVSDLIPIQSVARTDGGEGILVLLRQYVSGTAIGLRNISANNTYAKTIAGGAATGDKTQSTITSATGSMYTLGEIIVYRKAATLRVVAVGDSTVQAIGGNGPADGSALAQACYELGIQHAMYAQDGQPHANSMKNLDSLISTGEAKNALVFLQAWSQNSGATTTTVDLCWYNTMAMLEKLASVGSIGVLISPTPIDTNPSIAQYAYDKIISSGLPYVDQSTGLRQSNWTYISGYTSDGVHYNASGEAVIRPNFAEKLALYL